MAEILATSDYNAIRRAISTDIKERELPNEVIEELPYAPIAIRWLVAKVPTAQTQIDAGRAAAATTTEIETAEKLITAAILYCAALLCPAVIRTTSQNALAGDTSFSRPAFNPDKRRADLLAQAEEIVEPFLTASEAEERFTLFCRAPGRRAY